MAFDLDTVFTYHPPINDQVERYQALRDAAKETAKVFISDASEEEKTNAYLSYLDILEKSVPASHEKDMARQAMCNAMGLATNEQNQRIVDLVLTASMFANAGIAINESAD